MQDRSGGPTNRAGLRPSTQADGCASSSRRGARSIPWARSATDNYSDPVFATPAVGDITGTGELDIVFGSYDHHIYALRPKGSLVPGFPIQRADYDLVVADIGGHEPHGPRRHHHGRGRERLRRLHRGLDRRLPLPRRRPQAHVAAVHARDDLVESNRRDPQQHGTTRRRCRDQLLPWAKSNPASNEIIAVYADNGRNVRDGPSRHTGRPSAHRRSGLIDGRLAVVSTSCAQCIDGPAAVSAWDGSGHEIWSRVFDAHNEATSSPVLVDLTGGANDGDDVLVGAARGLYVLAGNTGKVLHDLR